MVMWTYCGLKKLIIEYIYNSIIHTISFLMPKVIHFTGYPGSGKGT
jgi:hypothetical protein